MNWPTSSLTDQEVRHTFFVPPEIANVYELALGEEGYRQFRIQRESIRTFGGDLLVIGWPDGTTITYHDPDSGSYIDVETLVETYRASAAMYRITKLDSSK